MKSTTIELPDPSRNPTVAIIGRSTQYWTMDRECAAAVRDQLDQILGDREGYKELEAGLRKMAKALHANIAALELLGLLPGADIMDGIAQWARSYRAPEPSPDLKEALGAALRSYETRHAARSYTTPPVGLGLVFQLANCSIAEAEEEIDLLTDHLAEAATRALPALTPEEMKAVRDCATAASAWAPSRTTSAGTHLVEQARLAVAAAERLSGAKAADDEPSEVPREQWERDTIVEGVASNKARLDKLESLYLPGLDERVTRLEQHAGEAQHALGTDGGEIGLHREQIGEITKRIEEIGLEIHGLQNWRRSCAHLPADAEALAALVDAAVERAVEPIRNTANNAHRRSYELYDRVQALELHRAGLTDGQAEAALSANPVPCPLKIDLGTGGYRPCCLFAGHSGPCM